MVERSAQGQRTLAAALSSIGDGVIATDRRGRVRFLNPVAETLTEWPQKDAKGRPLEQAFQSGRLEAGRPSRCRYRIRWRMLPLCRKDTYLISKTGEQVPLADALAPILLDSGRMVGSILVFRDDTTRRQSAADRLESERERLGAHRMEGIGRLAGGVAHDLNNLLMVIKGYAELLTKQMGPEDPARTGVEEIRKAGERAARLTGQLLAFSRGRPAKFEIADLNQVVTGLEKMLRRLIGEDIRLVTNLAGEPLFARVDVGQIEQVIMNLVLNARDAMPGGGLLALTTGEGLAPEVSNSSDGASHMLYAVLEVADTDTGIDERTRPRLFEPFLYHERSRPGDRPGSGDRSRHREEPPGPVAC
jgi:PAS domain S-box-containing protein